MREALGRRSWKGQVGQWIELGGRGKDLAAFSEAAAALVGKEEEEVEAEAVAAEGAMGACSFF